ncbi:DUF4258 domain-containing protein [Lentibacillus sp. N15]|uniref:DUF4258 domain-containing protein n=1 Tax=Lentibacillus songyuanensis TaxID=3136161 RepID=UPI0031BA8FF9
MIIQGKKMSCHNPKLCQEKHKRWKRNQQKFIPIGESEHELYRKHIKANTYKARASHHSKIRDFQRAVTEKDIADVTFWGWVIERNISADTQMPILVIMGYTEKQRPLHLVYEVVKEYEWTLITVYTPLAKLHKWNNDFTERMCFC